MGFDVFPDMDRLPPTTSHASLTAEIVVLRHELAEARAALRSLVEARLDHRVVGHVLVSEDAMGVAVGLVREWFGEQGG